LARQRYGWSLRLGEQRRLNSTHGRDPSGPRFRVSEGIIRGYTNGVRCRLREGETIPLR
jgi:hypothetical protein